MKKYHICFLLLLGAVSLCLASGFFFMQARSERYPARMEETQETGEGQQTTEPEQETETAPPEDHIADSAAEEESDAARQAAAGSGQVQAKGNFFLVSEDGFLLVFGKEPSEICLYTHIPISDLPEPERAKLRQGIWFSAMEEIYSYLESFTS